MMKKIHISTAFEKDVARLVKRNKDMEKLKSAIRSLARGEKLDLIYRDHKLTGNYYGCRDCHIESDWLLIYKYNEDTLFLVRTGTHSDLFKK
ncbi:MAG TPA: type II toxin-antitoxin system YafQ family toxin [Deltaproteobacteria bacterium]|nr:type II toxin-antitoxin system YafQ family toxin [Deltaproteobacteria bacterium]